MSATAFIESRSAAHDGHLCSICGTPIGLGDTYKREAVPPWAFRYKDPDGHTVTDGDGSWLVLKRCWSCTNA